MAYHPQTDGQTEQVNQETFDFIVVTSKTIGQIGYQLRNFPTTIDFTPAQDNPHSWST